MANNPKRFEQGLILLNTGGGRGKTTAAVGLAVRAIGHGMRVLMVQFVKSRQDTGEYRLAQTQIPDLEIVVSGRGFVKYEWTEQDMAAARQGWRKARHAINCGDYSMIILDEITYVVNAGVIAVSELKNVLMSRPEGITIVLTGRAASPQLIEIADMVVEMSAVKHPYHDDDIEAQAGIEY